MSIKRLAFSIIGSAIMLCGTAAAQEAGGAKGQAAAGAVGTGGATAFRVRFVAPGEVPRGRPAGYPQAGERLFDSDFRAGGVVDWDGQGLADGSYLCVVTAEGLGGETSRRLSSVTLQGGRASVGKEGEEQLK